MQTLFFGSGTGKVIKHNFEHLRKTKDLFDHLRKTKDLFDHLRETKDLAASKEPRHENWA
jgi:hypothetical protein